MMIGHEENKLAVVIVTYNSLKFIGACLESLKKINLDYDIFISDNNSTDATLSVAHAYGANIISNKENLGYSKAINNAAAEISSSVYSHILILNPDVVLGDVDFRKLIGIDSSDNIIGIKMRDSNDNVRINSYNFPNMLNTLFVRMRLHKPADNYGVVDTVEGSFMLMATSIFKSIGGFDEGIFLYGEDYEFCYRAKLAGYGVKVIPDYYYYHDGGFDPTRTKFIYKGVEYFFFKHKPKYQYYWIKFLFGVKKVLKGL